MGVGTPANLIECIARGIDMFDCVLPSRNGRHGMLYTRNGSISIKAAKWANDHSPVDDGGPCATSQLHSKAYLRHLFHAKEALGAQLATIHNLSFYLWLVGQAREHILAGTFASWSKDILPKLDRRL